MPLRVISLFLLLAAPVSALDPQAIDDVLNQTAVRQEQGLAAQLANPFPSSGLWRHEDFALAAYGLNQQTAAADAGLIDSKDNGLYQGEISSEHFHWHAYLQERIYFLYSSQSAYFPGRMSAAAEDAILEMLWDWASPNCKIGMAAPDKINWSWGSENHHAQGWVSFWGAAHIFKDHPSYQNLAYADGSTPAQMAAAFDDYFKAYVRERSLKGLAVEVASPTYAKYTLNTWYNLYDFAEDPGLKAAAGMLLDLYWADWAIEQIDGVRGGSRHRCYPGVDSIEKSGAEGLVWYHFGEGIPVSKHPGSMGAMTTFWRPSRATVGLALDVEGRGSYAYTSRRPGLKEQTPPAEPPVLSPHEYNAMDPEGGRLLRYTWCTPDFVMGTSQVEALPWEDWWGASSQNRWNGVIFGGHPIARIYTQPPMPPDNKSVQNGEWGVQHKGAMILQRLSQARNATGQMVWFDFSLNREEMSGWVFAEAPRAYAAVRVVQGGWTWQADTVDQHRGGSGSTQLGEWLVLGNEFSPIIMEVARKQDYADMAAFKAEILANPIVWDGQRLDYGSVGYGTVLTHFADESGVPWVDAVDLDFSPAKTYDAPYLQGDFSGGPVIIEYGNDRTVHGVAPFSDDASTVALWHFEEEKQDGSGAYYQDDISVTARTARDARVDAGSTDSIAIIPDGKFGNAIRCNFEAGDQSMMTGALWPVDQGTFRYRGWIRLNPGDTGGALLHVCDQVDLSVDASTATVTLEINKSGIAADTRACNVLELSAAINASNHWQYIDAFYDGTAIRVTTEAETVSAAGIGTFVPNFRNVSIGSRKTEANFVGDMDEVKISAPAPEALSSGSVIVGSAAQHFESSAIPSNTIPGFTVAPGSDRKLVVVASWEGSTTDSVINSVTYGSQAFTEGVTEMAGRNSSIWFLDAPAEGIAQDIVVSFGSVANGPFSTKSLIGVASLQNAAPGPPSVTDSLAPGAGITLTTTEPNTLVVGVYTENSSAGGLNASAFANNIYNRASGSFSAFGDAGFQNEEVAGEKIYTWVTDQTSGNSLAVAGFTAPAPPPDLDADGLADAWEIEHFGSVAISAGGIDEDQDGDGMIDLHEFWAGTAPCDPGSLLKITGISKDDGTNEIALSWRAVAGRSYFIQQNTSLTDPGWTTIAAGIPGVEPVRTYILVSGSNRTFYRVGVEH